MTCAARPYPSQWQRHLVLGDGWRIFVRPIRPDDESLIHDLLVHVSKQDLRLRFFDSIREFSPQFVARLTQIDYAREMAFVAIDEARDEILGVVRLYSGSSHETRRVCDPAEIGPQGQGLGWALMQLIIEYAKSEGLKRIVGQILQENSVMLKMCRELGFEIKTDTEDRGLANVTLTLGGG